MKAKIYSTYKDENKLLNFDGEFPLEYRDTDVVETFERPQDTASYCVTLHPDITRHTFYGFGGAFTESAATAYNALSDDKKQEFMEAYFDKEKGIGYTVGRLSIHSCDFSLSEYTYITEGDETLDSFDISRDKEAVIPMVKDAMKYTNLCLLSSPWSPPAFMKTNNHIRGGHLKAEYYPLWAKYIRRYIEEYKKEGVNVWSVTIQNEPRHHQQWESCLYTPKEESDYLGFLGKELEGTGVKIICFDHDRERLTERAQAIIGGENGNYCDGIANHWYAGDHFGEIETVRELYPNKYQIASEGCCFDKEVGIKKTNIWKFAEAYAHDICGAIKSGITHYLDWNITLNQNGGPWHNREGRVTVDVPVYCDADNNEIVKQPSYYYIGHFSKFIKSGAKCIAVSSYKPEVEACAFKNPDNTLTVVLLNRTDTLQKARLRIGHEFSLIDLPPHSIKTAVIN